MLRDRLHALALEQRLQVGGGGGGHADLRADRVKARAVQRAAVHEARELRDRVRRLVAQQRGAEVAERRAEDERRRRRRVGDALGEVGARRLGELRIGEAEEDRRHRILVHAARIVVRADQLVLVVAEERHALDALERVGVREADALLRILRRGRPDRLVRRDVAHR